MLTVTTKYKLKKRSNYFPPPLLNHYSILITLAKRIVNEVIILGKNIEFIIILLQHLKLIKELPLLEGGDIQFLTVLGD